MTTLFHQITICGVGLIGGSLALIAREKNLVGRAVGLGRTLTNLEVARNRGMIDLATQDPIEAARGADLVMLAVPIRTMPAVLRAMIPHLPPHAVITDVGSVKGWVVRELEPMLKPEMSLVAVHPIAGKETTGAEAADRELFVNRRVIVTPSKTQHARGDRQNRAVMACDRRERRDDGPRHARSHPGALQSSAADRRECAGGVAQG